MKRTDLPSQKRKVIKNIKILALIFGLLIFAQSNSSYANEKVQVSRDAVLLRDACLRADGCDLDMLDFILGFAIRGALSEHHSFSGKIGFEAGLRFFQRVDLGLQVGNVFADGGNIRLGVQSRVFLFSPKRHAGGPYLGLGYEFKEDPFLFGTLGFFGGSGLFFELDFRESHRQPLSVIPEFGIRFAF